MKSVHHRRVIGRRLFFCLLIVSSSFVVCLTACERREKKDYGGILRIGNFHKPTEINPLTTDSSISANLLELLFSSLVRLSSEGEIHPELAEKWEVSPDNLIWTFHLRRDVRFHNETPLDARDLKFTYDTIIKMKRGGSYHELNYVKEIRVLDPYSLQIILSRPDNLMWTSLGVIPIAPRHLLEGKTDFSTYNQHPIGSGPYRFAKQDDKEIVLEANEKHFGGRPYLDRIVVETLPSQQANLSHLIAGKIDMVFLINPEDFGALSQIPTIRIYNNWYPVLHLLTFNLKNNLFTNPEVRKALNYAVDKKRIVDRILKGRAAVAAGTFDVHGKYFNQDVHPYPYQPDLAVQLLQKQGWRPHKVDYLLEKAGRKFEFSVFTMEGHDLNLKTLQIIQEQFREIGIKMNIEPLAFDEYVERIFRKRIFESNFVYLIFHRLQDNNFSFWHSSQIESGLNFSSYSNPKVDALLEEARLSLDPEKRRKALMEFQQLLHDDPPGIFLFWRDMPIAIHKRFRGVPEKRMESLRDLVNVWVPREEQ